MLSKLVYQLFVGNMTTILFIMVFVGFIYFLWSRRHMYRAAAKMNGPLAMPIIGHVLNFYSNDTEKILKKTVQFLNKYPSPVCMWVCHRLYIGITKPEHLEIILNHPKALGKDKTIYESAKYFIGNGLISAPVDMWKKHRKIISPTFNQRTLISFIDIYQERSKKLIQKLEKYIGIGNFDLYNPISACTLEIICETAMGIKGDNQENTKYFQHIKRFLEILPQKLLFAPYHLEFIFNLSTLSKDWYNAMNYLKTFCNKVIESKREEYKNNNNESEYEYDSEKCLKNVGKSNKRFLNYLIELTEQGANFNQQEIVDEVATFIFAGFDTTALVDSYTLMMLGMHPEIQEQVYNEIYSIFGNSDRSIEYEDMTNMPYTEMVIKETMRLFPVPFIVRAISEDIQMDQYTIPAGSSCLISLINLHRDPKIWPEPMKFDPERFTPENITQRHPYSFIPFSAGSRNCIGFRYAMMAMKTVISTIIRKYKIYCPYKTPADIKLQMDIAIRPVNGHCISLEYRNITNKID